MTKSLSSSTTARRTFSRGKSLRSLAEPPCFQRPTTKRLPNQDHLQTGGTKEPKHPFYTFGKQAENTFITTINYHHTRNESDYLIIKQNNI
ncbi:hypothetical protein D6783_03085 [Candidatus Woesearchaeota archaeon]|nr:MAG: hypothetical protein D6783_03085 [Candidatus Woesearchaeota archaeon]